MKRTFGILPAVVLCGFYLAWSPEKAFDFFSLAGSNFLVVLSILPPVFILLGLFDAWVSRERVTALIGEKSGPVGAGLSIFLGAFAAGPLYLAFPIAETLLRKGTGLFNVFLFVGAWSTMKIPMFLFELQSLGLRFALTRYAMSLFGVFWIAWGVEWILGEKGRRELSGRFLP
jgi:uncharacterized membrane protein YraQ (UPF0718 family)